MSSPWKSAVACLIGAALPVAGTSTALAERPICTMRVIFQGKSYVAYWRAKPDSTVVTRDAAGHITAIDCVNFPASGSILLCAPDQEQLADDGVDVGKCR